MVLAGFAACTSDDVVISDSGAITSDTAEAYLTVNIKYADQGGTRATDGGLKDAVQGEYEVSDAYFYFYDEDGLFVSRAEVWDGIANDYTGEEPTANVQFTSNTVVVLRGLTGKGFPRYMVTVLNEPKDFENGYGGEFHEPAGTLEEMEKKLAYGEVGTFTAGSFNEQSGIWDANNYFVMSTTSFVNSTQNTTVGGGTERGGQAPYYFVTELQDTDFYEEPITAENTSAVEVYVERLAAKVSADYTGTTTIEIVTAYDDDGEIASTSTINAYQVEEKMSIAGEGNEDPTVTDDQTGEEEPWRDEAGYAEGDETIYIALDGWKLNATARQSYIMKNIDASWEYTWGGGDNGWDDSTNSRSYWGMAYLWDKQGGSTIADGYEGVTHNGYPVSSINPDNEYPTVGDENQAANYDADEINPDTWLNDYVKYTSLADGTMNAFTSDNTTGATDWNDYEYCAENTNTVGEGGIVDNLNSSAITSALIKATAYTRVDGTNYYAAQTLIRFNGELFTESAFTEYITNRVIADVDKSENYTETFSVEDIYVGEQDLNVIPTQFEGADNAMTATAIDAILGDNYIESMEQLFTNKNLTWSNTGSGNIEIVVDMTTDDDSYSQGEGQWMWVKIEGVDGAEDTYYMAGTQTEVQNIIEEIEGIVSGFNSDYDISAYLNGKMYYTVPIEHLNNSQNDGTAQTTGLEDGQYGVVRNHWYNLTIQGVDKIGKGITDDNEVIIPTPEDPTYFYVQATINILSWKSVEQDVTLGQY